MRILADQAFSRAAGALLVGGNSVRLLRDAAENFPAWREALQSATRSIFFESYILDDDGVGTAFRDLLVEKARAGVRVRVVRDWLGSPGRLFSRFWRPLVAAGGELRTFNPPRLDSPLGWLSRDHRKSIVVDGRIGFVTGLCVSGKWLGDPRRKREPWRDTGVEILGPAVADLERAFAQVWAATGPPIPDSELTDPAAIARAGGVALRVVASAPATAGLFRLDQMIAALARERLWLTDAYFVPVTPYVEALRAAARDGVDVRILVPGASDLVLVAALSRSGYRPLLEAGIRIFEWNGTMLHAKTAVADSRWARVGSTNLNLASFIGNYELDVAIDDPGVAGEMEAMYVQDLGRSTEVVLARRRRRIRPTLARAVEVEDEAQIRRARSGSAGRAAAGALRIGSAVGRAITRPRELGYAEGRVTTASGLLLIGLAAIAFHSPRVLAWPVSAVAAWFGVAVLLRAWRGYRASRSGSPRDAPTPSPSERSPPGGRTAG